ncbi:DciA family protein [Marinobacter sp.]|uniref:DciA family protein n=1 Tax=Marinobacter sp. TaxID=50741 RepID=UPI00384B1286
MKKKPALELRPESEARSPNLQKLLAGAQAHLEAEQRVLAAIPASLKGQVRFVSLRDGDMTLNAESSTTASQLRMRQHEIMEKLREDPVFQYVWRLRVKVAPPRFTHRPAIRKTALSNENARLLKEEAGHTKDKQLREILEKLASHVRDQGLLP